MLPFIVQRLTWWTTLKDTESKRYVGMSPAPWPQPMCFILPQLDIRGVPVLKLRKATGKLVHHGSLHCVACHHEVADSIERLIQVFDLDEKPFQDNVYTVSTSQTNWSETNSNYIDIYSRQTRKHQQTHTQRMPPSQAWKLYMKDRRDTAEPPSKSCGITKAGAIDKAKFTLGTAAETQNPTAAPQFDTTSQEPKHRLNMT